MKFSLNLKFFFINLFLAGVASYMLGSALSTFLNYELIPLPLSPHTSNNFENEKLPKDLGKDKKTFEVILERNIFNAQKTEKNLPEILPKERIEKIKTSENIEIGNTPLEIALAGTMIYGEKNSYAFISKKDILQKYVIFGIGECFNVKNVLPDKSCLEDSAKVLQIRDRWVLILYKGEKQALRMVNLASVNDKELKSSSSNKTQSQNFSDKEKSKIIMQGRKKDFISRLDSKKDLSNDINTFHFKRVWVDEQLANFEQLLNDARVVPIKKNEKPYFMFQFIKKESIYEKLGLQKNDIILEINGFIVDSVAKALKLLEVLQSEREISLKVERDGKSEKFHYYIN